MLKFMDGLTAIESVGVYRKLAALRPEPAMMASAPHFKALFQVDSSQWKETDFEFLGSPIRDQSTYGSCTGQAGVTALDITRRREGEEPVLLSSTFPYALVNGGRDNGASVTSILQVLKQYGTCLDSECGTDQIYQQQIPQPAFQTAQQYQALEAYICHSYDECLEAISRGFAVAFGIQVGQNFNRLDSNGVAPLPDVIIGGHAMCGMGMKRSSQGTWLMKAQNSWTRRWGINGYCWLTKGHFRYQTDAYAIMYAENINPPPPVPHLTKKAIFIPQLQVVNPVTSPPAVEDVTTELTPALAFAPEPMTVPELTPVEPTQSLMNQFEEPELPLDGPPGDEAGETPTAALEEPKTQAAGEDTSGKKKNRHKH